MKFTSRALVYSAVALVAGAAGVTLATLRRHGIRPLPRTVSVNSAAPKARVPRKDGKIQIGLTSLDGAAVYPLKLTSKGALYDSMTGERLRGVPAGLPLKVIADFATGKVLVKGKGIQVERPSIAVSGGLVQIGRRRYPARVTFHVAGTGLQLVNELDIEQYLEGVLPGELPAGFGLEAQKALAVAARTYALVQSGKHGEYDLCDRTCCQMYLGYHRGSQRGLAAVRATRYQCLWSGPDLVYAFYSADCGGESTSIDEVPLRDKPATTLAYLCPVVDAPKSGPDYCSPSPYHQWTRRFTTEELEHRLNARPQTEVGRLLEMKVKDVDPSGRVRTVLLRGELPAPPQLVTQTAGVAGAFTPAAPTSTRVEKTVTGWELRRSLGALALKSTKMTLDEPEPGVFRFVGSGFGHGLGLCQIGANGMARAGASYQEILAHYYPGTRLARLGAH